LCPSITQAVTALSDDGTILCRVFASKVGIPEDSVTGSMYTVLGPYWEKKTGVKEFKARQCSKRGGDIVVIVGDNRRVIVGGKAVGVMKGTLSY
jgi:predicted PhzF superfamily epimerase YddE/YHI9